jgi:hypothetical protein
VDENEPEEWPLVAWLHWCGTLNLGRYEPDAVCHGCRFEVKAREAAQAVTRYALVDLVSEPLVWEGED